MIFATVHDTCAATGRTMHAYLTEFRSERELAAFSERMALVGTTVKRTHWTRAHKWVRDGFAHDTALWVMDGRVRRARG